MVKRDIVGRWLFEKKRDAIGYKMEIKEENPLLKTKIVTLYMVERVERKSKKK